MTSLNERIEHSLTQLANNIQTTNLFGLERMQRAGGTLWEQRISVRLGHEQRFVRTRHFVDEGNIPIGTWEAPTDPNRVPEIAQALLDTKIWEIKGESFQPEQEHVVWQYVTSEGSGMLFSPISLQLRQTFYKLDTLLRSLANDLEASHNGTELLCQLNLHKNNHHHLGTITFLNQGNKDCLVPNPFLLSRGKADYLRVEMGMAPENPEGLTDAGVRYAPLPFPKIESLPPPWDSPYLLLCAQSRLECPLEFTIPLPPSQERYYARAIYSNYSSPITIAGMPVIKGRAFSKEMPLSLDH